MQSGHVMYVLACCDGSWYAGYTTDLTKRMTLHEAGKAAKYTRGRGPFTLVWYEVFATKTAALQAEYAFKQLTRKQKERYIEERKDK
ncbi:GIY-YIG nuclease family protein [Shouchella lonarensis]|uniref:Putative endonuclease n=1 Tax=Shouchella lonarensis TaxID=1464122 RepID=A0A1G6P0R8_9BACI|nr:GIY-YIG nuclease family protein [Shouchella lonarensis]SDC73639.1 putative endonuclease [Shouchella lonarensis]